MKSIIKWQTGEPTEFGEYLTVRKSRINGSMSVNFNMWAKDEIMRHGPLPKSCPQGWQIMSPDACDIIAWTKLSDITVDEETDEDTL